MRSGSDNNPVVSMCPFLLTKNPLPILIWRVFLSLMLTSLVALTRTTEDLCVLKISWTLFSKEK